ncbi:MAG: Cobyrinic acid ac-diamide synthase [Parcubacteria group bacterium GW2011_GWA2_42_14]|nr:MAG: Cobyrinic acid ac-diamide synthase [Parcubacteria group bacterium GW2011_GWA2_42_14]
MAIIISFCNQKGGVGKTTTALNTSAYLRAFGKSVLLIDIDPQANATSGAGINPRTLKHHIYHTLVDDIDPKLAIKRTRLLGMDILPASTDLAGATIELVKAKEREFRLKEVLKRVNHDYDYIIIDSPPSLGLLTINALVASHKVIIPVQCEYYSLEGLAELLKTVTLINRNLKTKIEIMGALLAMYDRKSRLNRAVAKEIRRKFPGYVFDTVIPRNISLAEAPSFGKTILHYDPYSHGAKAYRRLAEEILKLEKLTNKGIANRVNYY